MPRNVITDISLARAVALVRKGANQHSHVLLRKSEDPPLQTSIVEEDQTMSITNLKKMALMTEASRLHFAALPDAEATVFLEKTAEAQAADVEKAAYDKLSPEDKKKKDAEMNKSADPAVDLSKGVTAADFTKMLQDAIAPFVGEIAELRKQSVELDLEKAAADPAYKGYPGGTVEVMKSLRAIAGQPEEVRSVVINSMKSQAEGARSFLGHAGEHVQVDTTKGAHGDLHNKALELQKSDPKLTIDAAKAAVIADPANGALLMKALEEEERAQAA